MKKTLSINLNGIGFQIDEDAYQVLYNYIDSLYKHLANEKGSDEIIADIEARIAELLEERKKFGGIQIATIKEIEEIISTLGRPEDFEIEPEIETENGQPEPERNRKHKKLVRDMSNKYIGGVCGGLANHFSLDPSVVRGLFVILTLAGLVSVFVYIILWIIVPAEKENNNPAVQSKGVKRRLYRSMNGNMIGGVCSGLGEYFNVDVVIFRLFFVILTFLWGSSVVVYLALWIIIPKAISAAQKLELSGIEPTIENIKQFVQSNAEKGSAFIEEKMERVKDKNLFERIFSLIGEVFTVIFKLIFGFIGGCLGCFGLVILVPLSIVLVISIIHLIFSPLSFNPDSSFIGKIYGHDLSAVFLHTSNISRTIVAGVLSLGIPIAVLIRTGLQRAFKWRPISRTGWWIISILWVAGLALSGFLCYQILNDVGIYVGTNIG